MTFRKKAVAAEVSCGVLVVTAIGVIWTLWERQGTPTVQETTLESVEPLPETEPLPTEFDTTGLTFGPENGMSGMAKVLLQKNADTVGWITIPGTNVDNPIVQSADNDFYLNTSYEHKPFRAGTVFMDYRDVFGFDEDAQSENIVLYGHNMANNTMFGSLRLYRQDYSYYKTAPFIELYSNFTHYTYVICGLVITSGSSSAEWRYWDMEDLSDKQSFDAYVAAMQRKALVDIPVDVQYGDKLLTLSTCYSGAVDSRFLIISRRVRPDETLESFAAIFAE